MRIQTDQIVSLGYGKFARGDEIVAIEPIVEGRGPGRRSLVWVRGLTSPLVSSRTEEALVNDMVRPSHDASLKARNQRFVLERVVKALDGVPGAYRRRLRETAGVDLDERAEDALKAIA
jgi:hypothetical protein